MKRSASKGKHKKIEYNNYFGARKFSSNHEEMKFSNTVRKRDLHETQGKKSYIPISANSQNDRLAGTTKIKSNKGISYKPLSQPLNNP